MAAPYESIVLLHGSIQKLTTNIYLWELTKEYIHSTLMKFTRMPWICCTPGRQYGCLSLKMFWWHFPVNMKTYIWSLSYKSLTKLHSNHVLLKTAGKTTSLFRHDLNGLHSKQSDRLTISMNAMHKIPSKFVPKKFALSSKVANTRGTSKCCVGRNPYNGYKYLCGATPNGVFLMQWYDPLNKFMLLKVSMIFCFICSIKYYTLMKKSIYPFFYQFNIFTF